MYSENMKREAQRIMKEHVPDSVGNCIACWADDKVVVFGACAPIILARKILGVSA
jgi:hypothetical protein